MRVVLDTNILVSALLNRHGNPALVLTAAFGGRFDLVISPEVLAEYDLVLPRPSFKFPAADVRETLSALRRIGRLVHPTRTVAAAAHEPDNRFLECAEAGRADFIVTGNTKHFPAKWGKTRIIRPHTLLKLFLPQE